jgi:ABC-type transporter Mla maintaining outer membrane lipid asymmetry ATPase subunit MlaF
MSELAFKAAAGGPVIEMIDVTIGSLAAPEQPVIEGVCWTVEAGDYWAIGGLQASGKSDLLATVAGLVPPLRGTCRLFGRELVTGLEHPLLEARQALGLVFESGRLLNNLTVVENVSLPLRYHHNVGLDEALGGMSPLLEWLGLSAQAARLPGAIGRNLQRRVGLARALVLKPKVLLVDNPLSGLDPREAAWWLQVLDQLAAGHPLLDAQPVTLVVTGADLRPWRTRARSFGILKERRLVCLGTRQELETRGEPMLEELLTSGEGT